MGKFSDLADFCKESNIHLVVAADAEPVVSVKKDGGFGTYIPAGGVAVALEPLARASSCMYIARGKTPEDKQSLGMLGTIRIGQNNSSYQLKRLFFSDAEMDGYYYGFANQTLWPLCHVAFEPPLFHNSWYEKYRQVNLKFARAMQSELRKDSFVWINDYQLALVPSFLKIEKEQSLGFFWHIPWPTWEVFRILPQKKQLLESLLCCDYIAFHRGYQARNFLQTVERELEARIDQETNRVFYKNHVTTVGSLPMGIDTDVVKELSTASISTSSNSSKGRIRQFFVKLFRIPEKIAPPVKELPLQHLFKRYHIILGVDRMDYTKGLLRRLQAIELFFQKYPKYIGKVMYVGILSPSREQIPAYERLRSDLLRETSRINRSLRTTTWKPITMLTTVLSRQTLLHLYKEAQICLVTPLDDGMNLVSKEYVMASAQHQHPGMIVLSQFAGSAIDLTEGIIVNPYDINQVADAIEKAFALPQKEKTDRMHMMAKTLEERDVYSWAKHFMQNTKDASRQNRKK